MCTQCVDAVQTLFPNCSDAEMNDLLWDATCFPFGSAEDVLEQLRDLAVKSNGNPRLAVAISQKEFDHVWEVSRHERYTAIRDETIVMCLCHWLFENRDKDG